MYWFNAVLNTLGLSFLTILISAILGAFTAIHAWRSNNKIAFYFPILTLAIPPWLLGYYISDGFTLNKWVSASLSLGVCCSVYFHTIVLASLSGSAYRNYEMLLVVNGQNFRSLFKAIRPALFNSFIPAASLVFAEVLTDFGVSNYFGIETITMLTYNIWTSTWNLVGVIPGLVLLSLLSLSTIKQIQPSLTSPDNTSVKTSCLLSILPTLGLIVLGLFKSLQWSLGHEFNIELSEVISSLYLIAVVGFLCFVVALLYLAEVYKVFLIKSGLVFYGLSGTVIASVYLFLPIPLTLALVLAIMTRYYGLATNALSVTESTQLKLIEVLNITIHNKWSLLKIKLKLCRQPLCIGMCLIALDVLRELPISMILHPMNFNTIAMRMNYIARLEDLSQLGYYSSLMVFIGLVLSSITILVNLRR